MSAARVPIDLRRRPDARLQVSRVAAERFWRDGLAATRGEDIAAEVGISTRTLWRYFRSKEACVEPVLIESRRRFMAVLAAWPLEASIEEFLASAVAAEPTPYTEDEIAAMRVVVLGFTEPALRSAWLMVCDEAETECADIFARRLKVPRDTVVVREIAAAVSAAIRAYTDHLSVAFVERRELPPGVEVLERLAQVVREASNGRIGPSAV